eukprot:10281921-Alexandrium_andersonii.AAC.1
MRRFEAAPASVSFDQALWGRASAKAEHRRLASRVASDGLWAQDRIAHVDHTTPLCPLCHQQNEDAVHELLQCPEKRDVRLVAWP